MKKVLITGVAGFIGYHLALRLVAEGYRVVGIDNLNDYYEVALKQGRLDRLLAEGAFRFERMDIKDGGALSALFAREGFDAVVNLAAQAGVRYSLTNPSAYADSNLTGFVNILEGCRQTKVAHLLFASSSSVYGANVTVPFSTRDRVDHPVSLYAATKKANELMAHSYSHLFGLPCTGLRFFTVYGPWGRPDMAYFLFTRAIVDGQPIKVFNHGRMMRDFTYIDDIVEGVFRLLDRPPQPDPAWDREHPVPDSSYAPYKIYNIGNNQPLELETFIASIESALGKSAIREYHEMQPGDVPMTYADISALERDIGFKPATDLDTGIRRFVEWFKGHYQIA